MFRDTSSASPLISSESCKRRPSVFLSYTVIFCLLLLLIYGTFLSLGKTFIWITDGYAQHYNTLRYLGVWMREIVRSVLSGKPIIPLYHFSLGLGGDIVGTLHYYGLGDILNLFSVFVPAKQTYILYQVLIFLRLYLSGISFILFSQKVLKTGRFSTLCAALLYAFCAFSLYAGVKHPYFINPMIYLPLMLLGAEKIFACKRPYLFILSVTLAALSNFYFFYVLVFFVVIYTVARLLQLYRKDIKILCKKSGQIAGGALVGVLISAFILLPVIYTFLSDPRNSASQILNLFYPRTYYQSYLTALVSFKEVGSWLYFGFPVISLLCLFLLFRSKGENVLFKIFGSLLFFFTLFPVFGKILNGFSYATNRYCFVIALLVACITAKMLPRLFTLTRREYLYLGISLSVYTGICILIYEKDNTFAMFSLLLGFALLLFLFWLQSGVNFRLAVQKGAVLAVVIISLIANGYCCFSPDKSNYIFQFLSKKDMDIDRAADPDRLVLKQDTENDPFFRYSADTSSYKNNSSLQYNTHSTGYFWSLSNGCIAQFRNDMEMANGMPQLYSGFDDSTILNALASVRYSAKQASTKFPAVPYGYVEQDHNRYYDLWENTNPLPLAYTYSTYYSADTYAKLSALEKQQAMLQGAFLSQKPAGLTEGTPTLTDTKLPYTTSFSSQHITRQGSSFVVTKGQSSVTLHLDAPVSGEIYVTFHRFDFKDSSSFDLYGDDATVDPLDLFNKEEFEELTDKQRYQIQKYEKTRTPVSSVELKIFAQKGGKKVSEKTVEYLTEDYTWYSGKSDFSVNLGYLEDGVDSVTVTFPLTGIYSFSELSVQRQSFEHYDQYINDLKRDALQNVMIETNAVHGNISLQENKLLVFSIPYSKGWSAYVDGKKADILQANTMYLGITPSPGQHQVELRYETPFLRYGIIITALGIVLFLGIVLIREMPLRKRCRGIH